MTRSLTGRAAVVTGLVAVVAVLITAVVALPVTLRAINDDTRRALGANADLAARAMSGPLDTPGARAREDARVHSLVEALRAEGIEAIVVRAGRPDRAGLPGRVVAEVADGRSVSQRLRWGGRVVLAEGRPAGGAAAGATGDGIVLVSAGSVGVRAILSRLGLALGAGLVAGILAGALLARRLGAPLRQAAAAARRISAGDRAVRLEPQAPTEVAAVAAALNDLATALAASESRQRTFLTSISHELRTPLTTMKGYAEALADGVIGGGDEARHAGATMLAEGERLDRLVEDLLALARLEADDFPLEVVPVDLVGIATDARDSWAPRCAAVGVELRVEAPSYPVVVRTDPGRVRQVLDGLLENALRVVPHRAPVVVAVADGAWSGAYGPVLEVRDGGPGFTDDDLAVAFERGALYERYKGVRQVGSGLGLALAQRLVRRLGGRIEAGHAPEGGARMTVHLPSSGLPSRRAQR